MIDVCSGRSGDARFNPRYAQWMGRVRTIIVCVAQSPKYFALNTQAPTDLVVCMYMCFSTQRELDRFAEQNLWVLECRWSVWVCM